MQILARNSSLSPPDKTRKSARFPEVSLLKCLGAICMLTGTSTCLPAWVSTWRAWLKKPTTTERPRSIDLRPFLCEHIRLTYDLNFEDDRRALVFVSEDEWHALIATYKTKGGFQIGIRKVSKSRYETTPSVCDQCRMQRRSAFVEIEINLKFLIEEDMDPDTGLPKTTCTLLSFSPYRTHR